MRDEELAVFLNLGTDEIGMKAVAALPATKRALFDRMADLEHEVNLWSAGLGPKPVGVMIDLDKKRRK